MSLSGTIEAANGMDRLLLQANTQIKTKVEKQRSDRVYDVESLERAKSLSGVWHLGSSFTSQVADPGRMETGLGRLTRNVPFTL